MRSRTELTKALASLCTGIKLFAPDLRLLLIRCHSLEGSEFDMFTDM